MTESAGRPDDDAGDDPGARLRSVQRRLRREKRTLERLNPLEEPERYEALFTRVIDLEASVRELRDAEDPHGGDREGGGGT